MRKINKKIIKRIIKCILLLLIIGIFVLGVYVYIKIEPNLTESINKSNNIIANMSDSDFKSRASTNIYDKDGNLIKELKTIDYIYKTYDEINPNVFKAFVAIEDNRFYEHDGIDLKGLLRALYSSIVLHNTQGGSTITQQLAKNIYLSMDQTVWRKISEAIIADELENRYTKHQIFEFYVNNINYGNGCYSIESASKYYFNKSTNDLTIAEIAMLVGIPNNPTIYDPIKNFDNASNRKNLVLKRMYDLNMLSKEVYETEKDREIMLDVQTFNINNLVDDYAQSYAVHEAVESLMSYYGFQFKYDFDNEDDRKTYWNYYNEEYKKYYADLISGGYDIYTSIDQNIQNTLQNIVNGQMAKYTDVSTETGIYKKQAAATIIDNKTGLVVGIVGGRTQDTVNNSYNRAYLSARQPGSTIKPIIVYTPAIQNGYNENSVFVDEAIANGPKNAYSGYMGKVTMRTAVAQSINTVAFKLTQEVGVDNALSFLTNMNFRYLSSYDRQSPTIGLGGFTYGTTTVEMAGAYSTLARNGEYIKPTNLTKVYDRLNKTTIYENTYEKKRVYDDGASYLMTDVLKSVLIDGTGENYRLDNIEAQAGKTGTTNDEKDLWFCGYTPSYSMSVWMGDDIPSKQGHLTTQGYIWKQMMTILNEGKSEETFEQPESVYRDDSTLKYKKTKQDSKLEKNKVVENNRLTTEKTNIRQHVIRSTLSIYMPDYLLQAYTELFNNYYIAEAKDFQLAAKQIENADKIKEKVSDTKLLNAYESAKSLLQQRIEAVKSNMDNSANRNEENQKTNLWNNILNDFNNRKPNIVIPTPSGDNDQNQDNTIETPDNNNDNDNNNNGDNGDDSENVS